MCGCRTTKSGIGRSTELRNRTAGITSTGYGIAYIRSALSPRDAKATANILKRAVPRLEASDAPQVTVAVIPGDAKRDKFVRFSLSTKDHETIELHCCESLSGKYGVPRDMMPEPSDQTIKLRFSSGLEKEVSAEDIVKAREDFRVAVVVRPDDTPFEVIAVMTTGGATWTIRGVFGRRSARRTISLRTRSITRLRPAC